MPIDMCSANIVSHLSDVTHGGQSNGSNKTRVQPLVRWSESPVHPGLVTAMTQATNNPVVLAIKPDAILMHEVNLANFKHKVQDQVLIRHVGHTDPRSTLLVLTEDGSLRVYVTNQEKTTYWLQPTLVPHPVFHTPQPKTQKTSHKSGKLSGQSASLPVDFFEHCTASTEIEFSGNDLLQIYNSQQLKNRLSTSGLFIMNNKTNGFDLEVSNSNPSLVMVGCRVQVGVHSPDKAPDTFTVFSRTVNFRVLSGRWVDIPFTREESLMADKKFTIHIHASRDPGGFTCIDSVKVYTKTKEAFNWPDESEDSGDNSTAVTGHVTNKESAVSVKSSNHRDLENGLSQNAAIPITDVDRLLVSSLEVLERHIDNKDLLLIDESAHLAWRKDALELTTNLLSLPTPQDVLHHIKGLLEKFFEDKTDYHYCLDEALLNSVLTSLGKYVQMPAKKLDPEAYQRLLQIAKSVALPRPNNLARFCGKPIPIDASEQAHFLEILMDLFWKLHHHKPQHQFISPASQPGLTQIEATVYCLTELTLTFAMVSTDPLPLVTKIFAQLLSSDDTQVSYACKQALIRILRPRSKKKKVFIPSPPRCSTPDEPAIMVDEDDEDDDPQLQDDDLDMEEQVVPAPPPPAANLMGQPPEEEDEGVDDEDEDDDDDDGDMADDVPAVYEVMEPGEEDHGGFAPAVMHPEAMPPLEALIQGGMLQLPGDDEALMELAIALSLQEQQAGADPNAAQEGGQPASGGADQGGEQQQAQGQQQLVMPGSHSHSSQMSEQLSEPMSGPPSDDEGGSTAATVGSNMRASPAQLGSGHESESSNTDSISISGRSSAYGGESGRPAGVTPTEGGATPGTSKDGDHAGEEVDSREVERAKRLHNLRLSLLEQLSSQLASTPEVGGVRAIPLLQVLVMLTTDVEHNNDHDKAVLEQLLNAMINLIDPQRPDIESIIQRSTVAEIHLVLLRAICVLMTRSKSSSSSSSEGISAFVSIMTCKVFMQRGGLDYCLKLLQALLEHWKKNPKKEVELSGLGNQLLKPRLTRSPPDMAPFFLRDYIRNHARDTFEEFHLLLTEISLRLPYQTKKVSESASQAIYVAFPKPWDETLAEYMMLQNTPYARRQVRKLLMYMCGTREQYRKLRDNHTLEKHIRVIFSTCRLDTEQEVVTPHSLLLSYEHLTTLVESIKIVNEIASNRSVNWQQHCMSHGTLRYLIQAAIYLEENVSHALLNLVQYAICLPATMAAKAAEKTRKGSSTNAPGQQSKSKKTSSTKTKDKDDDAVNQAPNEMLSQMLVEDLLKTLGQDMLLAFMRCFLLESNISNVRWQAHRIMHQVFLSCDMTQKEMLVKLIWSLWHEVPNYGAKASQFVDLLGYFSLKTSQNDEQWAAYADKAMGLLTSQNTTIENHPNATVYHMLQGLVELDGYYLESAPCLVCNNPELPLTTLKLSSVKVDSKTTSNQQIIKLVSSHTISRVVLRLTDIKRTKMIRTLNLYYNNRTVQAIVELKNKPDLWHKAKKVTLTPGQSEIKIDLPLPITACNLMLEYADFYDNLSAASETLQCPRCSASVPANPGMCNNCGENVFQCHKCRAINYDQKDPFLCKNCGFCKYAKFEISLLAKATCAVDPIENDEDHAKTMSSINTLLDKADRLYRQIQSNKPALELLLTRISEFAPPSKEDAASVLNVTPAGNVMLLQPPVIAGAGAPTGGSNGGTPGTTTSIPSGVVNKFIEQLALKYSRDCKAAFDELSKIIQKIVTSRQEILKYDRQRKELAEAAVRAMPRSTPPTPEVPLSQSSSEVASYGLTLSSLRLGPSTVGEVPSSRIHKCYSCANATVRHCVMLLHALASNNNVRSWLCRQGLLAILINQNLRQMPSARGISAVRNLICALILGNEGASEALTELLLERISQAIRINKGTPSFATAVRQEMLLLCDIVVLKDQLWETRIRAVLRLFLQSLQNQSPDVLEYVGLPCLQILYQTLKTPAEKRKTPPPEKQPQVQEQAQAQVPAAPSSKDHKFSITACEFLQNDPRVSFFEWRKRFRPEAVDVADAPDIASSMNGEVGMDVPNSGEEKLEEYSPRQFELIKKYGTAWLNRHTSLKNSSDVAYTLQERPWLRSVLFSNSGSARQVASQILETMWNIPSRRQSMIRMLTSYLTFIPERGEVAAEYIVLYSRLISQEHWRHYLVLQGILEKLELLIKQEIQHLNAYEDLTSNCDLALGFSLKALIELLSVFVDVPLIKQRYKRRLVVPVLTAYLAVRRLFVQRTKLIDETQEKLQALLADLTTGTEEETREFMSVCVKTLNTQPLSDHQTSVFIFDRICSLIYKDEDEIGEFFMSLDKDPQQEDFLQGRMVGNPYSSTQAGLGPLMRDVKNKICTDCELVALLEDDTGMELLVSNKIISLDLPVADVYKKIWLPEHKGGEPMRVVYRMRGLLGDATEDMVNTLDSGKGNGENDEVVYKLAGELGHNGGLQSMLQRVSAIRDMVTGRALMTMCLKLLGYCVKIKNNRRELTRPEMNTIRTMLGALNLALLAEQEAGVSTVGQTITEEILVIMEIILQEASSQPPSVYKEFARQCGDKDQLMVLLDRINSPFVRANSSVLQALMRLIPFLAFGDQEKMETLVNHFHKYLDYEKYDQSHEEDERIHLECFCVITNGIENNANGNLLKDIIVKHAIVTNAVSYIKLHAPEIKTLLATDSENWKEFLGKPSLPYVLRMLTGLCKGYEPIQLSLGNELIQILHKLEQASSEGSIGSLAENLMEAMKANAVVSQKVEEVRHQTKAEKKRLAMAMRDKQLAALKMTTNDKGQVKAKSSVLEKMEDLKEEHGLVCCICREGYRNQPNKVLGVYTFTKRVALDDFENKPRKANGYSTVSHFNVVHVDCHMAAVRVARVREEWDSAALQNANTRCNGLLPMWGPSVPESAFAGSLARHNTYLQECTQVRDSSYSYTLHDLKQLLLKFAQEASFSADSGGGGRQSNMHLIPYMLHLALYVLNTTRTAAREDKNLQTFMTAAKEKWVDSSYEVDGPLYQCVLALAVWNKDHWNGNKLAFLKRLVILAQARHLAPSGGNKLSDKSVKEYSVYKPYLMYFALVDGLFNCMFKKCSGSVGEEWCSQLAEYIRHNDQALNENAEKLLRDYEETMLPCESISEFLDVVGMLGAVSNADNFIGETLASAP